MDIVDITNPPVGQLYNITIRGAIKFPATSSLLSLSPYTYKSNTFAMH